MDTESLFIQPHPEYPYFAHKYHILIGVGQMLLVSTNLIGYTVVEPVTAESDDYVFYGIAPGRCGESV